MKSSRWLWASGWREGEWLLEMELDLSAWTAETCSLGEIICIYLCVCYIINLKTEKKHRALEKFGYQPRGTKSGLHKPLQSYQYYSSQKSVVFPLFQPFPKPDKTTYQKPMLVTKFNNFKFRLSLYFMCNWKPFPSIFFNQIHLILIFLDYFIF